MTNTCTLLTLQAGSLGLLFPLRKMLTLLCELSREFVGIMFLPLSKNFKIH